MHDGLKQLLPGSFFIKYSFILPASLLFFVIVIVFLKKRKRTLFRITYYLNVLLLVLLLVDAGWLTAKVFSFKKTSVSLPNNFVTCDTCRKPDVYFLLMDEYAGNRELKDVFHFDNSVFEGELSKRGFHVIPETYSNYNYTPFSVASILNLNYLEIKGRDRNKPDITYSYETIRNNQTLQFLLNQHYQFYNYSVFDFEGQPARVRENFLPTKTRLITAQTFLSRLDRDIRFNMALKWKIKNDLNLLTYYHLNNNNHIYRLTWEIAEQKSSSPKFIYAHLMMPHYPYYFDRTGKALPFEKLQEGNQVNQQDYIEYLQYSNKKIMELVDHILQSSASPPIIILMGDHGFRHFTVPVEEKYYFLNLEAVFLPQKNYAAFYDNQSAVNFFRAILNSEFGQKLPYLKDSIILLKD
jgi:hypothetical protein